MKIYQDQSEPISKQSYSLNNDGFQSAKSHNSFQSQSFESQHWHAERKLNNDQKKWTYKSCWFNCLVIVVIILFLGMDLNYRTVELQKEPKIEDEDKIQISPKTKQQSQQQQLTIIPVQRTVPEFQQNQKLRINEQKRKQIQWEQQQQRRRQQQWNRQKECTKIRDQLKNTLFLLNLDKEQMKKQQAQKFHRLNENYCHFHVLYEIDFDYIVDVWNSRQELNPQKRQFINKTALNKQEKRAIFIFLHLYFWGGTYIHTSLGLKFGDLVSERFIYQARVGKEVLFAEADRHNQNSILLPKRNFRAMRVQHNYSPQLQKFIRKIIAKQNWIDSCTNYQCMIMKNAIKSH